MGDDARLALLEEQVAALTQQCAAARRLTDAPDPQDLDAIWLIVGAIGVFSMHMPRARYQ